jgi:hypothetical protein
MFNHVNLPVTVKPNHRTDSPTNCATTMVSQPIVHRWCGASCSTVDLDVSSPQIAQQEKKNTEPRDSLLSCSFSRRAASSPAPAAPHRRLPTYRPSASSLSLPPLPPTLNRYWHSLLDSCDRRRRLYRLHLIVWPTSAPLRRQVTSSLSNCYFNTHF